MELYRKQGVSPFGTCWFMFLQMPIFMGLYYALQESITFRLAPFQPLGFLGVTWIENLAAPDMLWEWGQSIPWLTSPDAYGGFLYLGPYLNLLPIIAVALMIMQQKMMTPPPTDEQQEMQQKMMKYMMVFMGLMFYKVASGLCIYFIASSLWGFAERKLLPKKKPTTPTEGGATPATSASLLSRVLGGSPSTDSTTAVTADAPAKGKGRRRGKDRGGVQREEPADGGSTLQRMRRWFRRKRDGLSEWWAELLKQAAKKER
jgi:YidC/Oxa1 family membrane protein insertase